jgi:phosphohistidine phosphatase SixA
MKSLRYLLLVLPVLLPLPIWAGETDLAATLKQPGHVIMLRHASAPGVGDPADFTLGNCATQRNLDAGGRAQARAAGEWLRRQGIRQARLYSSQWCRCLDTARLLELGPVAEMPELNNVFTHPQDREANMRKLNDFLATLPADGPLIILVTHNRNIYHLTGISTGSGEGVLLKLNPGKAPGVVGRVRFELN